MNTTKYKALTLAQEAFCQQVVLNGGDQSAAYRAAYPKSLKWKDNAVNTQASILSKNSKVQVRVKDLQAKVAEIAQKKFEVDAEYVLRRHFEIDTMDVADILDDMGSVRPIKEWPLPWRQSISGVDVSELYEGGGQDRVLAGIMKKIKFPDKIRNLELLGKHVSVNAYRDQVGISDANGKPIRATWELAPIAAKKNNASKG